MIGFVIFATALGLIFIALALFATNGPAKAATRHSGEAAGKTLKFVNRTLFMWVGVLSLAAAIYALVAGKR
ncbi:hypothetical protein ABZX65_22515 [Streptomyces sp. NPDC003300]|uniref:hypothetical protein n=1 Tax=unclassified Streptomyces TaxID=2593676 RepID=UPI0033A0470A